MGTEKNYISLTPEGLISTAFGGYIGDGAANTDKVAKELIYFLAKNKIGIVSDGKELLFAKIQLNDN